MSWVNDIIGKTKEENKLMSPNVIKEQAKVFTSALLNKREKKRKKQNKGAHELISSSSSDDDTYFSVKGGLKYADL